MDPSLVHRFRGLHDAVTAVAFSPGPAPAGPSGARQLAAASKDKSVLLWTFKPPQSSAGGAGDFDAGKAFRFSGHSDAVYDVVSTKFKLKMWEIVLLY